MDMADNEQMQKQDGAQETFEDRYMADDFKAVFDLSFESLYSQCNKEMGYQQSKRDQTIAFYIAIISFLVPAVIEMKLDSILFAVVYGVLWLVGWMLSGVVRRYRVYKECYWLNLRTISTLQRVKADRLNKDAFQKTYAATMRLNRPNVVVAKDETKVYLPEKRPADWEKTLGSVPYNKQVNYYKTWKKNSTSAEYLLYMLIVLISSLMMAMAVNYLATWVFFMVLPQWNSLIVSVVLGVLAATLCAYNGARAYICDLVAVYAYCFDHRKESFNKPYTKAWFLHCFNSELEPNPKTKNNTQAKEAAEV